MKKTLMIALIFLFTNCNVWAIDWFVDKVANGKSNGKSWSNAWENFAHIDWGRINPGDTIYISGGADSKTYYEKLTIDASGIDGAPITITAGVDANHNGDVIIDGEGVENCIVVHNEDYILISDIRCLNAGQDSGSGSIHIDSCRSVKIEFCSFENINTHGAIFINQSADCVISNNIITTEISTSSQTDGIYGQRNDSNIYENNHISILNNIDFPHCDAIQLFEENNYTIRGNTIIVDNNSSDNKQGIFCTDNGGTSYIYNNLILFDTDAYGSLIAHENVHSGFSGTVRIFNNTSVSLSGKGNCVRVVGDNDAIIQNNIFWRQNSTNTCAIYGDGNNKISLTPGNVDYNIYYSEGGSDIIFYNGESSLSLNEWQDLGQGMHSMNIFPDLNSLYVPNDQNAPPVDEGLSLDTIFDDDIDRTFRPQGPAWDIGAYEYYYEDYRGTSSDSGGCFISSAGLKTVDPISRLLFTFKPFATFLAVLFLLLIIAAKSVLPKINVNNTDYSNISTLLNPPKKL